jgi:hypothetical protein
MSERSLATTPPLQPHAHAHTVTTTQNGFGWRQRRALKRRVAAGRPKMAVHQAPHTTTSNGRDRVIDYNTSALRASISPSRSASPLRFGAYRALAGFNGIILLLPIITIITTIKTWPSATGSRSSTLTRVLLVDVHGRCWLLHMAGYSPSSRAFEQRLTSGRASSASRTRPEAHSTRAGSMVWRSFRFGTAATRHAEVVGTMVVCGVMVVQAGLSIYRGNYPSGYLSQANTAAVRGLRGVGSSPRRAFAISPVRHSHRHCRHCHKLWRVGAAAGPRYFSTNDSPSVVLRVAAGGGGCTGPHYITLPTTLGVEHARPKRGVPLRPRARGTVIGITRVASASDI